MEDLAKILNIGDLKFPKGFLEFVLKKLVVTLPSQEIEQDIELYLNGNKEEISNETKDFIRRYRILILKKFYPQFKSIMLEFK